MRQPRSIRFHLSAVFFFFFLLVLVLGLFSISRLTDFNRVSSDVADLWLPNTRLLGDLNNFTSDFRAAEGTYLLASDTDEIRAIDAEMQELDRFISQAMESYEQIHHDGAESTLYQQFKARWGNYRNIADQVLARSRTSRRAEATTMYMTTSRTAYDAASDTLGDLTSHNVANAQEASGRVGDAYREALLLISIALGVAGLMVTAALFYIRRSISEPLLHLASCMHRLAANKLDISIEGTERSDEIGEMARAALVFRNNAVELIVSQRGLAQQASMLEEKLAHEKRLTELQRNFLSMASHEFRTPLTIIDGHAQRLIKMSSRLGTDDIVARAGKVRSAVLRMTSLIDRLINASRLVDGGAELYFHPTAVDLTALLREVCHLHREITPRSQISERFGPDPLQMVGDPKLLYQVFSNLLGNAVKYSPAGGKIDVVAREDADEILISVQDHGVGIPKGDLSLVFDRYYRGGNVSGIVGTGIGLYLVKMVVELHSGEITVQSTEGEGSCFTVRLPRKPRAQANIILSPTAELVAPEEVQPAEHRADAQ